MTVLFVAFACEFSFTFTFTTPLRVAPKIGAVIYSKEFLTGLEGLKKGMISLGYTGANSIFYREYVIDGDLNKIENIMEQLKKDGFEIIFVTTTPAAKKVFSLNDKYKFQVIFNEVADPVSAGLVKSMDEPGMNFTGVSHAALRMIPKRLEILKEFVPDLKKIIFLTGRSENMFPGEDRLLEEAANLMNVEIEKIDISDDKKLLSMNEKLFGLDERYNAIMFGLSPELVLRFEAVRDLCITHNLLIMPMDSSLVKRGASVSYAPEFDHVGYQSAFIADMILKGASASDVPVQMPDEVFIYLNEDVIDKSNAGYDKRFFSYADEVIR